MSEFIGELTKAEHDFMFSDPIYPDEWYDEDEAEQRTPEAE